jgi:hypothetical protein
MHAPRNLSVKEDKQIILLIIDPQVYNTSPFVSQHEVLRKHDLILIFSDSQRIDFHEGGSLAVPGSTEDRRETDFKNDPILLEKRRLLRIHF